jgi:hypothetical protein
MAPIVYAIRTIVLDGTFTPTVDPNDNIVLVDASRIPAGAQPFPLILRVNQVSSGQQITVKKIDAIENMVDIRDASGTGPIDGAAPIDGLFNYLLMGQGSEVTFVADKEGNVPRQWSWKIVGEVRRGTSGQTTLRAGTTSVTVHTLAAAKETSNILLTPLRDPEGSLWVVVPDPSIEEHSFTIQVSAAPTSDVPIAYLIMNEPFRTNR